MGIAALVARRYLLSRRLPSTVNVLAWVAMLGIAVVTGAFVIVLSTFNGFNGLIAGLYQAVDPPLKIRPAEGKYLPNPTGLQQILMDLPVVETAVLELENRALLQHHDLREVVVLRGVGQGYNRVSDFAQFLEFGDADLGHADGASRLLMGSGVAYKVQALSGTGTLELVAVSESRDLLASGAEAVQFAPATVGGLFQVQKEYDEALVLVDLATARQLFDAPGAATALAVGIPRDVSPEAAQEAIQAALGSGFLVLNQAQQHPTLFRLMETEKKVGMALLVLIQLLVAVNIVGALALVVHTKRADIAALRSMGAPKRLIQRIFLTQSLLTGGIAGAVGAGLGAGFVALQEAYGLLKLRGAEDGSYIIDHFPMQLQTADVLVALGTVLGLSALAGWVPARRAAGLSVTAALRS